MDRNKFKLGFELVNPALMDEVEAEIRELHPSWNDKKVAKERNKILRKATLYNNKNKKAKKPKPKPEPGPKDNTWD